MNRHGRFAALLPLLPLLPALLASPVGLAAPAVAAPGTAPAPAMAAAARPSCELVPGQDDPAGKPTYRLVLSGFTPEKDVQAASADKKYNPSGTTSKSGSITFEGVPYGSYRAAEGGGKAIKCAKVPAAGRQGREPAVTSLSVGTKVEISKDLVTTAGFDPMVTMRVSGPGTVRYEYRMTRESRDVQSGTDTFVFTKAGERQRSSTGFATACAAPGAVVSVTTTVEILTGPSKGRTAQDTARATCPAT
ncbi:hypothetical protein ACWGNM_13140 [Streptomyces sp. NPDC055796]